MWLNALNHRQCATNYLVLGLKPERNAVTIINYRLVVEKKNKTYFCYIDNSNYCMTTPRDGVSLLTCMPS